MVLGMGVTGASCARFFARSGREAIFADSREAAPGIAAVRAAMPSAEIRSGAIPQHLPNDIDCLIVSPGLGLELPVIREAREAGVRVCSDIDFFLDACDVPLLTVTGSNGKSTVTTMVAAMLGAAGVDAVAGGNLGTPVLDLLETDADLFVLELSSFQLERCRPVPAEGAVILNISEDHLDHHRTLAEYAEAKQRIYGACRIAVVNRDDPATMALVPAGKEQLSFGLGAPAAGEWGLLETAGDRYIAKGDHAVMPARHLRVTGNHNLSNALAAFALADTVNASTEHMVEAIGAFTGLPHRMQAVPTRDGICWINDSKATNEAAATASLRAVSDPVILIAGGDAKGADFAALADELATRDALVLMIGRDAEQLERAIGRGAPVQRADGIEDAVRLAIRCASPGHTVLLAPACASQDMFANFAERGERFMDAVREYAG